MPRQPSTSGEKGLLHSMRALQQENKHLRLLVQISQELGQATSLDMLLDRTIGLCRNHLGFESTTVRLLEDGALRTHACYGLPHAASHRTIHLNEGLGGQCATTAEPVLVNDVENDPRYVPGLTGAKSNMVVPLISEGEVLGILNVESTKKNAFTPQTLEIAWAMGAQLAARIRITRLSEDMTRLALTDQLTGLPNYPHFMQRMDEEIARSERYGLPLSLVLLDLDDFKAVNDEHGHLCGNFILEFMGRFLQENMRRSDTAGRFGGEEFCILLPQTSPQQGAMVAEKLRLKLGRVRLDYLPHAGEAVMDLRVSATFGVSGITFDHSKWHHRPDVITPVTLVCEADDALYQGKQAGKNTVLLYERHQGTGSTGGRSKSRIVGGGKVRHMTADES